MFTSDRKVTENSLLSDSKDIHISFTHNMFLLLFGRETSTTLQRLLKQLKFPRNFLLNKIDLY